MKASQLLAIGTYQQKRIGLIFAAIFTFLQIVNYFLNALEESDLRLLQSFVLSSLAAGILSKEKFDDERYQVIRYFSLRTTFYVLLFVVVIHHVGNLNIAFINTVNVCLALYFIVFYLADRYNPKFMFEDKAYTARAGNVIVICMFALFGVVWGIMLVHEMIKSLL